MSFRDNFIYIFTKFINILYKYKTNMYLRINLQICLLWILIYICILIYFTYKVISKLYYIIYLDS